MPALSTHRPICLELRRTLDLTHPLGIRSLKPKKGAGKPAKRPSLPCFQEFKDYKGRYPTFLVLIRVRCGRCGAYACWCDVPVHPGYYERSLDAFVCDTQQHNIACLHFCRRVGRLASVWSQIFVC